MCSFRGDNTYAAHTGAASTFPKGDKPLGIGIRSINNTAVVEHGGQMQRFAAASGASIKNLLAGSGLQGRSNELTSLVLNFKSTFLKGSQSYNTDSFVK